MASNTLVGKNIWIIGPWRDSLFFILTPLLIIPVISLLEIKLSVQTIGNFVLAYGSLGHHLPGLIRAYTDPELFNRYKTRFITAPILLIGTCALFAFYNLNGLGFIIVMWGTWHGAMQVYGFLRIYDAKVRSFTKITAWLDWWMCLAWFGAAILHSNVKMSSILGHFYGSGGALISPVFLKWFTTAWDAGTLGITALFIFNLLAQWKKGSPPNPLKILSVLSSVGFWWYCMVSVNNLLLGLALWEIFHDFQYNALVWVFNGKRVSAGAAASAVEKFLFQPSWTKISLYLILIFGYGYLGVLTSYINIHLPSELLSENNLSVWLTRIIMASGFLHFYFDGFIWKMRDDNTRRGLDIRTENSGPSSPATATGLTHALKWSLFLVPVVYLGLAQARHWGPDPKAQHLNMTRTIPESWYAHLMAGTFYKVENNLDSAILFFTSAARLKPDFAPGYMLLADVYYRQGKAQQSSVHYLKAVELEPDNLEARLNLANLFLELKNPEQALIHFKAASVQNPSDAAITFGIAASLLRLQRLDEAEPYLLRTLDRIPNHARANHYLGLLREMRGDIRGAVSLYQKALAADPTYNAAALSLQDAEKKLRSPVP